MTRIIAGQFAGRRLAVPRHGARPTTDRVREALFSSIEHRMQGLSGRRVLDLYAGSGALGLEALSRGAAATTEVERDRAVLAVLRANVASLAVAESARVVAADVQQWAPSAGERFDLVLLDPPYDVAAADIITVLSRLAAAGALAEEALIAVERPSRDKTVPIPSEWPPPDRRRYGETAVWYGRAKEDPAAPQEG